MPMPASAVCLLPCAQGAVAQVFDLQNKVVAASAPVEPPVRWVAHTGTSCIDICERGAAVAAF